MFTGFSPLFRAVREELAGPPAWDYEIQARHISGAHAALAFCNVFPVVVKSVNDAPLGGVVVTFNSRLSDAEKVMLSWYGKVTPHAGS